MSTPYSYATVAQEDAELPLYTPTTSIPPPSESNKDHASARPNVQSTSSSWANSSNSNADAEDSLEDKIKSLEARMVALESIVLFPSELEVPDKAIRDKAQREEKQSRICLLIFFWAVTAFVMLIILLNTLKGFRKDITKD